MKEIIPEPLEIELVLKSDIDKVWAAWTTEEGVCSFFAPACLVEPKVGGAYEIYFNPEEEVGKRGAEGTRILAMKPKSFFSFTWNNPPTIPEVRWQYALVCLYFEPSGTGQTSLRLVHLGWGAGESWQKAREYFDRAWNQVVIPRLIKMLKDGPINWDY